VSRSIGHGAALAVLAALAGGCPRRPAPASDLSTVSAPVAPSPPAAAAPDARLVAAATVAGDAAAPASSDGAAAARASSPDAAPIGTTPDMSVKGVESDQQGDQASDDEGPLVGEERERDPASSTVTIRITVDFPRRAGAHVLWGRKDFGEAPLEIQRPRNSGPLDLIVVAPGYLPLHARAFTDRDDKLSLRLFARADAPQLLGYRSDEEAAADAKSHQASDGSSDPLKKMSKKRPKNGLHDVVTDREKKK
jgi:hypothetical protein